MEVIRYLWECPRCGDSEELNCDSDCWDKRETISCAGARCYACGWIGALPYHGPKLEYDPGAARAAEGAEQQHMLDNMLAFAESNPNVAVSLKVWSAAYAAGRRFLTETT